MINFFKSETIENIKIKLLLLYILNLTDTIFTQFLLFKAPDLFVESNSLMKPIITDCSGVFVKVIGMALLLLIWYKIIKYYNFENMKTSNHAYIIVFTIYSIINVLHLINMCIYIYVYKLSAIGLTF